MSKAPKNIEKILLGVAVVAAGGLIFLGVSKSGAASEGFPAPPAGGKGDDTGVKGAMKVPEVVASVTSNRNLEVGTIVFPTLPDGVRQVNAFVGVPLFANRDDPNNPVDLPTSKDVHPPIPNVWWIKYNVSPEFSDSPQRDDDGDGFTNLEEFNAETDPSDPKNHPMLVAKLSFVKDESRPWIVEFGFETGGKWLPKFKTGVNEAGPRGRVDFDAGLEPGDIFFSDAPLKDRLKFIEIEERTERNERIGIDQTLRYAIFEDQKENKKGERYEVPNRMPRAERLKHTHYDRKAVLDLRALGLSGKEFVIEERTKFALPPTAKEKDYFLKEVTPEGIVVEWQDADGTTQSVTIPKGGLPDIELSK